MEVGERHLGGRYQKEVPVAGDPEQIGFEFRELPGGLERCTIDEIRWHDLQVPMLTRLHVEHEVRKRPRQPRARAEQNRKPRAGNLRRALEIENAESGTEIPVRLRLEVERRRFTPRAHDDVVRFTLTDGHAGMRQVGQRHEQNRPLLLHLIELDAELPNLLRPLTVGVEDGACVFALPLRPRDFVAGRVLLALQPFELGNQAPPPGFERRELLELGIDGPAAVLHPAFHLVLVVAHERWIKHGEIVCHWLVAGGS